jgi:hypothetical protein
LLRDGNEARRPRPVGGYVNGQQLGHQHRPRLEAGPPPSAATRDASHA